MRDVMQVLCDALIEAGRDDAAEVVRLVVERDDLARWLRTEKAYSTPGRDYDESYGCPECETYIEESHGAGCARADYLRAMVPGWADAEIARAWGWAIAEDKNRELDRVAARRKAEREAREPLLRQLNEASDRLAIRVAADMFGREIPVGELVGLGAWVDPDSE